MKPVFQDKFFQEGVGLNSQRGNCLSAVVASLLEIPLAAVPNFVESEVLGGPEWWTHMCYFLYANGKDVIMVDLRNPPVNTYYEMGGLSTRATEYAPIHHSTIFYNGKMVHDPHPSGEGILTQESGFFLRDR